MNEPKIRDDDEDGDSRDTHLVNRQLVRVPLGDAFLTLVHHCHLDVGALGRHDAARGSAHVAGADAANF